MSRYLPSLLLLILFGACAQSPNGSASPDERAAPELLERNEGIRNGGEWDRVRNRYVAAREAIERNPEDAAARLEIARLFVREARVTGEHGHYYPAALGITEEALAQPGVNPAETFEALTLMASVQLSQHEFAQALATAKKAEAINDKSAVIYGALTDAYVELGDYENAVEAADRMVELKPDLRSYARISYLRQIYGKVDESLDAMRLALDAGSVGTEETAWVRTTLADLLAEYGRTEEAEAQYLGTLEDRPGYPFAKGGLARLYADRGEYEQAEKLLDEARRDIPEVAFYEQLISIYERTDRTGLAEQTEAEVLDMLADDVAHGHNMNLEYTTFYLERVGDADRAYEYAKREYDRRPQNIDVNRALARVEATRGNDEAAREYLSTARRTDSQSPQLSEIEELIADNGSSANNQ